MKRLLAGDDSDLAEAYSRLRAESRISLEAQRLVTEILRQAGETTAQKASGNADVLAHVIVEFLLDERDGGPLSDRLASVASDLGLASSDADTAQLSRFAAAVLMAIWSSTLTDLLQFVTTEKTLREIQAGRAEQNQGFALLGQLVEELGLRIEPSRETTQAGTSIQRDEESQKIIKNLSREFSTLDISRELLGLTGEPTNRIQSESVLAFPALPDAFIDRQRVREAISNRLKQRPVLAVTGYPSCGKTSALAGYVRTQGAPTIWISLPRNLTSDAVAVQLVHVALQFYFDSPAIAQNDIEVALHKHLAKQPLSIVIDNAEQIRDPMALEFLFRVADASNSQLTILLAYAEDPGFTISANLALIPTWRLPGMDENEAESLYDAMGVGVDETRHTIIALLCAQCDGHIGLLRLCRPLIDNFPEDTDWSNLINIHNADTMGHFFDAIVHRFVSVLSKDERQLCLRLSVVLDAFTHGMAEALWEGFGNSARFLNAWTRGKASVY
ncbi:MAG: hypothetical protein J3T61_11715, partial [Candidatus Brocadiales bacterium]|nr:hypothetical protein [Candidatus Bathyanammoxibius sp.]